jgi:site-specific DNA recombinase
MTVPGRKFIAPKEPNAGILKWSFKTLVTGLYTVAQIYKEAKAEGYKQGLLLEAIAC